MLGRSSELAPLRGERLAARRRRRSRSTPKPTLARPSPTREHPRVAGEEVALEQHPQPAVVDAGEVLAERVPARRASRGARPASSRCGAPATSGRRRRPRSAAAQRRAVGEHRASTSSCVVDAASRPRRCSRTSTPRPRGVRRPARRRARRGATTPAYAPSARERQHDLAAGRATTSTVSVTGDVRRQACGRRSPRRVEQRAARRW